MNMTDYLSQYREETPQWLQNYQPGQHIALDDILSSRTVYYPGSGSDGQPIETFNRTHAAHCFIYVDGLYTEYNLRQELYSPSTRVRGYRIIGRSDYTDKEVWPNGHNVVRPEGYNRVNKHFNSPVGMEDNVAYARAYVFERLDQFDDSHGADRFVILFVKEDAILTYQSLFTEKGLGYRPWGLILQDHGLGGNYDRFGARGLMEAIANESDSYPHFALVAQCTEAWKGMQKVEDVDFVRGGMYSFERYLYRM